MLDGALNGDDRDRPHLALARHALMDEPKMLERIKKIEPR